jgi:hypothetical protein
VASTTQTLAEGVVGLARTTVVAAVQAVQEIGTRLGSTALGMVRGSIKAAEDIGGDLFQVGRNATNGVMAAAEEIGGDLARIARGAKARRPLRKAKGRGRAARRRHQGSAA